MKDISKHPQHPTRFTIVLSDSILNEIKTLEVEQMMFIGAYESKKNVYVLIDCFIPPHQKFDRTGGGVEAEGVAKAGEYFYEKGLRIAMIAHKHPGTGQDAVIPSEDKDKEDWKIGYPSLVFSIISEDNKHIGFYVTRINELEKKQKISLKLPKHLNLVKRDKKDDLLGLYEIYEIK